MSSFLGRLGRGAAPGWLVVELGSRKVSLAHVRHEGDRPVAEFAEERDWEPKEPRSLERIAKEFGARRFACTTLLKPAEYQILLVDAPAVKRDELKPAIRWRIKDMLDYHVDDATIDVLDLPLPAGAAARPQQMYAVAARNDTLRATLDRREGAGIRLAVIDIPDTAQRNAAVLFEAGERGAVALSFDEHGGLITAVFGGELYLSRRLDVTAAQLAEAGEEERARLLDRILVETQRSLDHCERSFPFFSLGRVLLGPVPEEAGLRAHLAANLYLPVEPLDLAQVMRLPAASAAWSAAESARWLKLLGAGLRIEKRVL
ncbi:MAG: agglutinin biogenesis protein MshI [Betaproteobacteria bacterium]